MAVLRLPKIRRSHDALELDGNILAAPEDIRVGMTVRSFEPGSAKFSARRIVTARADMLGRKSVNRIHFQTPIGRHCCVDLLEDQSAWVCGRGCTQASNINVGDKLLYSAGAAGFNHADVIHVDRINAEKVYRAHVVKKIKIEGDALCFLNAILVQL
jgi:hypothetical protein